LIKDGVNIAFDGVARRSHGAPSFASLNYYLCLKFMQDDFKRMRWRKAFFFVISTSTVTTDDFSLSTINKLCIAFTSNPNQISHFGFSTVKD